MPADLERLDDDIAAARERMHRHNHLDKLCKETERQLSGAQELLDSLERRLADEQEDVERLENAGFARFAAAITGRLESRLEVERAEAAAARLRAGQERQRVEWIRDDLRRLRTERAACADADQEYAQALAAKEQAVTAMGLPEAGELASITGAMADHREEVRETHEAIEAGRQAMQALDATMQHLLSAGGTSTWDLLGGGSMISHIKHTRLESTAHAAALAQRALDAFSRELADVGIDVTHRLPEIRRNWVTDVLFDNLLTDAMRHGEIRDTTAQLGAVRQSVIATMQSLHQRAAELEQSLIALDARRESLLNAPG